MTEQPPVPWKRQGFSVNADGLLVRLSSGPSAQSANAQKAQDEHRLAVANLVAAAPELLAACKEILRCDFLGDFSQPLAHEEASEEKDGSHPRLHAALDAVRMAVAHAEGASSNA